MSLLPNARVIAPVPDSFDFDAWTTPPAAKNPTGRTLRLRNKHNLDSERFNEISIDQTLNCKEDRVNYADVGPPLKFFYAYTSEEMTEMILSEAYCTDVGPLPAFLRGDVERARRKRADHAEADKAQKEKIKGQRPLHGAMVNTAAVSRVPGERPDVVVPDVVLRSVLYKLYVPLHWFSDDRLQIIQHRLHDIPTKLLKPDAVQDGSAGVDKVLVFDMLKMSQSAEWGTDELHSCMSAMTWQQAAVNMEAALAILSEKAADPTKATFVSDFRKHRLFFMNYGKFEENYPEWYSFEREARHDILRGVLFDASYYAQQVDGILHAKRYSMKYASSESPSRKRLADREPDFREAKASRYSVADASPSSSRGDSQSSRGDNYSFRSGAPSSQRLNPSCIICEGSHRLKNHPSTATSFGDGGSCFSVLRHNELWTSKPFKGTERKRICIEFNFPNGCQQTHGEPPALHICSLCGKNHAAIPRNAACRSGRT
ncbi:hypothetical protein B0H11DRAFT_1914780 [Mycena galericulata]|nr:hypothetical protein B0H11DRAFT_1914780 [Mycena galericulata]